MPRQGLRALTLGLFLNIVNLGDEYSLRADTQAGRGSQLLLDEHYLPHHCYDAGPLRMGLNECRVAIVKALAHFLLHYSCLLCYSLLLVCFEKC